MNHRKEIQKVLIALAEYYDKALTITQLTLYTDDLQDMSVEELSHAVEVYRRDPKNLRFPLPAQLRTTARPEVADNLVAIDLAKKIAGACRKYDHNWDAGYFGGLGRDLYIGGGQDEWPTWKEAVEAELGPLGYEVIRRSGGWRALWDSWANGNDGTFIAQVRDHAEAVSRLAKAGHLNRTPTLPYNPKHVAQLPQGRGGNVKSIAQIIHNVQGAKS